MRSISRGALLALSLTAGCSYEWDRLDPSLGTDAGVGMDVPAMDAGGCSADPDCANNELGLRVCDTATRRCVQCVPTRDACPTGQYCGTDNRCATGCRDDQACAASVTDAGVDDAGVARGGRCNPQTRACVDCLSNEHCPLGQLCMGSQCVPGCDTQRGCAEGRACCGGGCIDVQTSPIHCGACGTVCATVNGTPACVAGRCGVGRCNAPFGDCDGDGANGCETNTQSTPAHCGACGMACPAVTNGTAACSAGRCVVGQCTQGFADCDGDASNGCETNLNTTLSDCGRCGNACNVEGGSAVCAAGVCQRSACNMGRGDCDGNTANGCETELDSDPRNCRVCGNACNVPNATAACIGGGCAVGTCNTGFGNCDGNTQNGCESNLRNNLEHCGACGVSCAFARATAACTDGACAIAACEQGFGNCDGMTSTGCETSTSNNPAHCGTCGTVCPSPPGATAACNNATCGFTCNTGLADCDSNTANGCEQDTVSNVNHCGGCNRRCVLPNADASCTAGACRVLRCLPGFADCDGNASNGCEVNTLTDLSHCGSCNARCGGAGATFACTSGTCAIVACNGSGGNCDNNIGNGCETDLAVSMQHCGACGTVCPSGTTCTVGRCATSGFAGYGIGTSPSDVQWIEACTMSGRQNVMVGTDDGFFSGALPFPVQFWGASHREWVVTSNGQVGFGNLFYGLNAIPTQAPFNSFGPLPIPAIDPLRGMFPAVYALGFDLILGSDGVCIVTVGTAPNRRWVAETRNARLFNVTGTAFTFELIAHEGQTYFDVLYNTPWAIPFGAPVSGNEATLGTQDFRLPVRAVTYSSTVAPGTRLRYTPL
jgi:hypothetical protein